MKDIGELRYSLRIEVERDDKGIYLNQRKYGLELLHKAGMTYAKPIVTTCDPMMELGLDGERKDVDSMTNRRMVSNLIYLTIIRPNIYYSVQVLSQFMRAPTNEHMRAAKRVLRYIKAAFGQNFYLMKENTS